MHAHQERRRNRRGREQPVAADPDEYDSFRQPREHRGRCPQCGNGHSQRGQSGVGTGQSKSRLNFRPRRYRCPPARPAAGQLRRPHSHDATAGGQCRAGSRRLHFVHHGSARAAAADVGHGGHRRSGGGHAGGLRVGGARVLPLAIAGDEFPGGCTRARRGCQCLCGGLHSTRDQSRRP